MEHASSEEIKKHVKVYVAVFVALAFLTVVTVTVSYLKLSLIQAMAAALAIATVKGSLVAACFMHLISERKIIFSVLILTFVFFLALLVLPALT
jgi:caa(3)-type oxidase subunit IV